MRRLNRYTSILCFGFLLPLLSTGCEADFRYIRYQSFSDVQWDRSDTLTFEVDIEDTAALYDLDFLFRHTDAYPKTNLWVDVMIQGPDSSLVTGRRQITLADNKSGWHGHCLSATCEFETELVHGMRIRRAGRYRVVLMQVMRTDPLIGVLDVGIRLRKVTPVSMRS